MVASSSSQEQRQLPMLDMAQYRTDPDEFVERLRHACHTVGFFTLRHDYLLLSSTDILDNCRTFFSRPLEEKLTIDYNDNPSFRGYMPMGVENTAGNIDHREQIEYAVEYPSYIHSKDDKRWWPAYHRLKGHANPWPDTIQPTFRRSTMDYVKHVTDIANTLVEALCRALQLDPTTTLSDMFLPDDNDDEVPHWVIKLIAYPHSSHQRQGVGAHTDTSFLTLVLQDGIHGGLEVFSHGEWIPIPPDPSVLVVNLGESAEIWSRGYFLATPHRVMLRPSESSSTDSSSPSRLSVALFYNPKLSSKIEPLSILPDSVPWERPDNDHWRRGDLFLPTVGDNTIKSLARSHPIVFRRHHPDLCSLPDGRIVRRSSDDGDEESKGEDKTRNGYGS